MKRVSIACVAAACVMALASQPALADVKTREKGQVKFEGMLGRMFNMFGGKAARDGVVSTSAVKGNRKVTLTDATGRIVDLDEQKVYELDMKKKTYEVTTFDELRREMQEASERAQREATKEEGQGQEDPQQAGKEIEVDFDVKETGQTKSLAGYDARQVIMTVTVREKGKPLEEGGGLVMTTDAWMGPEIPAMKELHDFERRYWQAVAPEAAGISAEQMAAVLAMFPMVKTAMERANKENVNLTGTTLASTMTFESVKSKEQMEQSQSSGGGGIGGMLARRVKRDPQARSTILTVSSETLEVATTVPDADLAIPADFKQKK